MNLHNTSSGFPPCSVLKIFNYFIHVEILNFKIVLYADHINHQIITEKHKNFFLWATRSIHMGNQSTNNLHDYFISNNIHCIQLPCW